MFTVRQHPDLEALDPSVFAKAAAAVGHPELEPQIHEALLLGMTWYDLLNSVLTFGKVSFKNWFDNWKRIHGHAEPTLHTEASAPAMPPQQKNIEPKPLPQAMPKETKRHEPERGT